MCRGSGITSGRGRESEGESDGGGRVTLPLLCDKLNLFFATICGQENWIHEARKFRIQTGFHSGERGLRDRNRKRLEVSLCDGGKRGRPLCALLSALSGHYGNPGAHHGIFGGARGQEERGRRLQGTGAEGEFLAPARLGLLNRLCASHDVLHDRLRLDGLLFREVPPRRLCEGERRGGGSGLHKYARQSG